MEPVFEVMRTALFISSSANGRIEPRGSVNGLVIGTMGSSRNRLLSLSLLFNIGKLWRDGPAGAAVKAGLAVATGECILFQAADLEYDPADYAKLLMPVTRFSADIIMGSRIASPPCTHVAYFWHKIGNRFITLLFNVINNTTFTDIYTCYLIFRRSLVKPEELKTSGWEQQAEILTLAVKRSKVYYEVPICYYGRTYEEGKKIRAHHMVAVIRTIVSRCFRVAPEASSNRHKLR